MTLIPIGRFARASRLSIKSLRNYDRLGLLPAAHVDPQSGYCYYRLEQLVRADTIRSLRMVDMPLATIGELLEGDDPNGVLTSHLAALELQRDALARKVAQLRRLIDLEEYSMSTSVTLKTNPAITAIAHHTTATMASIATDIPAGFATAMSALEAAGAHPVGPPFAVYYQAPDGDSLGDIALCIPVATEIATTPDTTLLTFPAGDGASIIHQGSYDDMGASYGAVVAWIEQHGHRITGPPRETYLNDPTTVAEADLMTEIVFPIDADDAAA